MDTGNTKWIDDPQDPCREIEQKEQEYRDYTCSGSSCDFSVTNTQWIDTGNYRIKEFTLTIAVDGTGTTDPSPGAYTHDCCTNVTITAIETDPNWEFSHWTGNASGTNSSVTIHMDSNKTVTAHFTEEGLCSVHLESSQDNAATANKGSITFDGTNYSLPEDISITQGNYSATYNPESGYEFKNWSTEGNVSVLDPNSQTTTVTVSCGGTLRAVYEQIQYTLTTSVSPLGSGYIEINPPGGVYDAGTVVNLTATPDTGYEFVNWTGDTGTIANVTAATTITMTGNYSIVANFAVVQGWGFEIQPNVTKVGFNQDFTVNVTVVHYGGEAGSWKFYVPFNTSLLEVTDIVEISPLPTGNAPDPVSGFPKWNNTEGWLQHQSGVAGGDPKVSSTFVSCTITFRAKAVVGTTYLNFTTIDPPRKSTVILLGSDVLNWASVVNGTVEVVPGATLEGHVSFYRAEDPGDPTWGTPLVVTFFDNATKAEMFTKDVTTDAYGNFTIPGIASGAYDIGIKARTTLSSLATGVEIEVPTTVVDFGEIFGVLREGDITGDNYVGLDDYTLVGTAYDSVPGDDNWNEDCDFNCDGYVGLDDYTLVGTYYDQEGD